MSSKEAKKTLTPSEEQVQLLITAKKKVQAYGYNMQRALDNKNLDEAIKFCCDLLDELRTSKLSPKNYYELYMTVFDELRYIEMGFREENLNGTKMQELYEKVQHVSNIVPRLYLLVCVGSVYIKSKEAPAKFILKDLVEMCKGVQHPTRGLFLRNYLSQMCKDKLPDKGSEYEGEGGDVKDAVDFILTNFNEMVNLWCRLKVSKKGESKKSTVDKTEADTTLDLANLEKEREKREKERMELKMIVGTNLHRLSQLDGVDLDLYTQIVLPKVLSVITSCNDALSQQYLMECVVQVFPDEFHISTMHEFLEACLHLHENVDLKVILTSLMDRLSNYAKLYPNQIPKSINIVEIFSNYLSKIYSKEINIKDVLSIQASLMRLSLRFFPDQIDYLNTMLEQVANQLKESPSPEIIKPIRDLLLVPLDNFSHVLELDEYLTILSKLGYDDRKLIAMEIIEKGIQSGHKITHPHQVNKLFNLIEPLIKDTDDTPEEMDEEEFEEEQTLVAKLIQLFDHDDPDQLFKILSTARKHFGQGGLKRIQYTLPPLTFAYLRLVQRIHKGETEIGLEKIFQYIIETIKVLSNVKPIMAFELYLQSALTADYCEYENAIYECLIEAFLLYEEADSKQQLSLLIQIVNTLRFTKYLSDENYENLTTKTCQYSSKLLRKPDQCRAAFSCSHLFWPHENSNQQNSSKALECLQWSLKIVKSCMSSQQIPLFVEILNIYMYHFDSQNDKVTADYLNGLIDLINTNITTLEEDADYVGFAPIDVFYNNTLKYLRMKQEEKKELYKDVVLK